MKRKLSFLLPFAVLFWMASAYAGDPAACSKVATLQAEIQNYHNEYNKLTGKNTAGQKQQLKTLIAQANQQLTQAEAACGNCSPAQVQSSLNAGTTPLSIYNSCGTTMSVLYGMNYKGGKIAYMNPADGTGFVAAPGDYPMDAFWVNMSGGGYVNTNATGTGIGTGKSDTAAIISVQGAPSSQPGIQNGVYNYAAYVAKTQAYGGYSDWYLPSQNEMVQALQNVITPQGCYNRIPNNLNAGYWTSTETGYNTAIYITCGGGASNSIKNRDWGVRLIRAFPVPETTITGLSPSSVTAGQTLTITGSNFSSTAAQDTVTFTGGATATASTATATSLTVVVPAGAISGPVTVTTNGVPGTPSTASLVVTPAVTSFSPLVATPGTTLTITGSSFSATAAQDTVTFAGGATATALTASATTLTVVVPANAINGPFTVTVNGSTSAPSSPLTVQPVPQISAFTPASTSPGSAITLSGNYFSTTASQNVVTFGAGVTTVASAATASSLTVTVPLGAQTGPLTVTSNGIASAASSATLTIQYAPGSTCSASDIQNRLNNGQTPLSIYNLCGKTLANLYGRNYKGGIIAYLDTTNGTGFVAAPTDFASNAFWQNMSRGHYIWANATATAIGAGKANTATIIQALGTPSQINSVFNYAAYAAAEAAYGGYRDWYLPDQSEMTQVMLNVITPQGCYNGIANGANGGYWTSSEVNYNTATYIGCEGNAHLEIKNNSWSVRLIRAFPVTEPAIASFAPTAIGVGQTLTITGSNFSTTAAQDIITFAGGATATASTATATTLTVVVPPGAKSGPITVTTGGVPGTASSASLNIFPVPTISSFTPATGSQGKTLTVTGSSFSTTAAQNTVLFAGGASAVASTATATSLSVVIPANAQTGVITVSSNGVLSVPSATSLTVLPTPGITSFTPGITGIGQLLTLTGSNFSPVGSQNVVFFGGGASTSPTSASATSMTVTVPAGAQSGTLSVTTNGVASQPSSSSLTVQLPPGITSFSPTTTYVGNTLAVSGMNFSTTPSANVVTFGGGATAAAITATAGSLTVVVPTGAQSGALSVTTNGIAGSASTTSLTIQAAPTTMKVVPDSSPVSTELHDVAWGNGTFVVSGMGGTTLRSTDGISWTSQPAMPGSTQLRLKGITYGNNEFVAVGYPFCNSCGKAVYTSADGKSWAGYSVAGLYSDVAWGNGTFVAVGGYNSNTGSFTTYATSPDGSNWAVQTVAGYRGTTAIAWGANVFVAVGSLIETSPDGKSWTTRRSSDNLWGVTWSDTLKLFVAVGQYGFRTSPDGITWTEVKSSPTGSFKSVSWSSSLGLFAAVGYGGSIATSPDGMAWTPLASGTTATLAAVTAGNGQFVAIGSKGEILRIIPSN